MHTPAGIDLRPARSQDASAVAEVFGAARAQMRYLPRLHSPAEDVAFFSETVVPSSYVTVAVVDDVIVGFSAVKDGWLDHLYVVPARQGAGIGGMLLVRAMTAQPSGLHLWVFAANGRAIAFYARAGFAEVLRTDGSANEERQPDVQMRWPGRGPSSAGTAGRTP